MKSIPSYVYILFIGIFLTLMIVFYFTFAHKQEEETLFLNETIAAYIPSHVDLGTSRVKEQLFLEKSGFEADVTQEVMENYPAATAVTFEYLEEANGAIKGIYVKMFLPDDKYYTSTYKLSEI